VDCGLVVANDGATIQDNPSSASERSLNRAPFGDAHKILLHNNRGSQQHHARLHPPRCCYPSVRFGIAVEPSCGSRRRRDAYRGQVELYRLWYVLPLTIDLKGTALITLITSGLPTDVVQLHSLTVSPDPPEPGKDLTINASGYVSETINVRSIHWLAQCIHSYMTKLQEDSYANVVVKLGLVKLLSKKFDICEEA
jgi:hypothetical protein